MSHNMHERFLGGTGLQKNGSHTRTPTCTYIRQTSLYAVIYAHCSNFMNTRWRNWSCEYCRQCYEESKHTVSHLFFWWKAKNGKGCTNHIMMRLSFFSILIAHSFSLLITFCRDAKWTEKKNRIKCTHDTCSLVCN